MRAWAVLWALAIHSPAGFAANKIVDIAAGDSGTCVLLSEGKVKCWGWGGWGENGNGSSSAVGKTKKSMGPNLPELNLGTGAKAISIARGDGHSCAILSTGKVKCWGSNVAGELHGKGGAPIGTKSEDMGDAMKEVPLPGKATQVVCGESHTCALLEDKKVYCWGGNYEGQVSHDFTRGPLDLGEGLQVAQISAADRHTCARTVAGEILCWGANDVGQLGQGTSVSTGQFTSAKGKPFVNLGKGRKAVDLISAWVMNCAILDDKSVKCWGFNSNAELGIGDKQIRGTKPEDLGDNLKPVDLGTGMIAKQVSCGRYRCCALLEEFQTVKCWGSKIEGDDDNRVLGDEPGEMGDSLPYVDFGRFAQVRKLALGRTHSCALLEDDRVLCFGKNDHGQLGIEREVPFVQPSKTGGVLEETKLW